MIEVYDLHKYTHTVVLHIQKTKVRIEYCSTSERNFRALRSQEKDACITYDIKKKIVRGWGHNTFKSNNKNDVRIDNFGDKLYQLFKDKVKWEKEDQLLLRLVSKFMKLLVEFTKGSLKYIDKLHYICVVPSEWEEEMREVVIRPIFIQSNLISKDDHKDRLLFCSNLETIFYNLMDEEIFDSEKRRKTILCRFVPTSESEMLIKLDLVSAMNYLFDFPDSLLYPKVERFNQLSLTINTFKDGIRTFIKDKLPLAIQEEIIQIIMDTSYYGPSYYLNHKRDEDYDLMKPLIINGGKWKLNKDQKDFIESICIFDICFQVRKSMTSNIDDLISNNTVKEYDIFVRLDLLSSGIDPNKALLNWSDYLMLYNRTYSCNESIVHSHDSYCEKLFPYNIMQGAFRYGRDVINNTDIYGRPRLLSAKSQSTSIFRESKPDAIMNIDILIDSTILSYSLLDEDGFVKKVRNHDDFLNNKSLRSLGSFFSFSETTTTLNVKSSFIDFAENYLTDDSSFFSGDKNSVFLQLNSKEIETMLCKNSYAENLLVSTQQPIYIKAFLLLYMLYIKYVISRKLSDIVDPNLEIKIGYDITVEKILMNRLFDTKEGLKDIVFASSLIREDDNSKKLRITTHGERIMHLLRRSFAILFPIKSFFVLAQLHENYIQLTLNHVVTDSGSDKEDPEAIIIRDKIFQIPNVYTSLCLNMWNNIVEDCSLVQSCDRHQGHSSTDLIEIFSLKNQVEFSKNFTQYISKDNMSYDSSQLDTDEIIIQLSISCNCKVYLMASDIIDISFQPMLEDIASLVSASLINKELFGKFRNIQYLFHLIQFDYNAKLHNYFVNMLEETTEDAIIEREVDISHYVIPRSLKQPLQPVLDQQPISYKEFQVGTLHLVYGDSYGYQIAQGGNKVYFEYKSKIIDTVSAPGGNLQVFRLFKRDDLINDFPTSVRFYLNPIEKTNEIALYIKYLKFKNPYCPNPVASAKGWDKQDMFLGPHLNDFPTKLQGGENIRIVISILYEAYLGSLTLRANVAGYDISKSEPQRIGAPMHLSRR